MPKKTKPISKTPPPSPALMHVISYGGSLLAFLYVIAIYSAYSIDFPLADQWDFVPTLERALNGELTLRDLWAQHNEHRLIFPRLLMIALAVPSHWNLYWEYAANLFLALLTWLTLCLLARGSGRSLIQTSSGPVYLVFALLIFSMSQWGNYFLGWQMQEFMNVLAAILALVSLCWLRYPLPGILSAALFGIIATYSFANGLLVWPIGLILLWLQRKERGEQFRRYVVGWCCVSTVVFASYFIGYHSPAHHTSLLSALGQPLHCMIYVFAYLGQPMGQASDLLSIFLEILGFGSGPGASALSIFMGLLGLLLWGTTLTQLRLSGVPTSALHPWIGIASYAIGTAIITALGRVEDGVGQALSSRYITMANLLWFSVAAQTFWAAHIVEGKLAKRALPYKIGVLCGGLVLASLAGTYRWTERYHAYSSLREEVLHGHDAKALSPLYPPDPARILERRPVLQAQGLGVFKGSQSTLPTPGTPESGE